MNKLKFFSAVLLTTAILSCKKDYLETDPSDAPSIQDVYSTTEKVSKALEGAYKSLFAFGGGGTTGHDDYGQRSLDLANDLMGQDMVIHTTAYGWYNADYQYTEWLRVEAGRRSSKAWFYYYKLIKQANTILKNIDGAVGPQAAKDQYKGESHALRAYAYFYLINYYQQTYKGNENKPGVPLNLDPNDVMGKARGTVQMVYDQIDADLAKAEELLTGKPRVNKVHMDVSVVRGFQARVALLKEDWATAAAKANAARQGYTLMTAATYPTRGAFSQLSNPEWMWGSLIPSAEATIYASSFSHLDITNNGYAGLGAQKKITKALYDAIPVGDVRKTVFKTPGTGAGNNPDYNQLKFQVPTPSSWAADYVYMRAAEMYLIEAEALARAGQDAPARTLLISLVQARYPGYNTTASGAGLIGEILLQRRIELWGEGWSLIDIKRNHTGLNRPTGAGNHGSPNVNPQTLVLPDADPKFLMKLPQAELDLNPLMTPADQNPS